ncbi:MAG: type II secretion system F family protein [Armatimonadetes bacterium]|nr:type II secretion system F family protein [Armatimonadota bacterium]
MVPLLGLVQASAVGALDPVSKMMLAGAVVCAVLLFWILKSTFSAPVSRSTLRRLQTYVDREENLSPLERLVERAEADTAASRRGRGQRSGDLLPTVTKWLGNSRIRFLNSLSADLARIGSNWRASEILYMGIFLGLLVFLLVGVLLKRAVLGLGLGAVMFLVPVTWVRMQAKRWTARFETQLADTLLLMSNAMSAGYGFQQAMAMVAREGQPPMSDEFTKMNQEVALGVTANDALSHMSERVENADFTLAVTAIQISNEVGGELAPILRTISETIRERVRIRGEIRILTTQGRVTGLGLTALPIFMFFLLNAATSPDPATHERYASPLFNGKVYPYGPKLVVTGVIMQIIGYFFISRIINIEV